MHCYQIWLYQHCIFLLSDLQYCLIKMTDNFAMCKVCEKDLCSCGKLFGWGIIYGPVLLFVTRALNIHCKRKGASERTRKKEKIKENQHKWGLQLHLEYLELPHPLGATTGGGRILTVNHVSGVLLPKG